MSEVEKAYYLYRKLGDIYEYKVNYRYADELTYEQYMAKIKLYQGGNYYFANLTSDIMHIKTGMKNKNFGLSEEQLRNKLYSQKPEKNRFS